MKCYYPTEFFTALVNCQPMVFYPVETPKQDARLHFDVQFLNPCVNRIEARCLSPSRMKRAMHGCLFVRSLCALPQDAKDGSF